MELKAGERFNDKKIGRVRIDDVSADKVTYSVFPTGPNQASRRVIVDTKEVFEKRFPNR